MADLLNDGPPLQVVQLDTLVVMKIVKHCTENFPELVTGQLLGMDVGSTLEVTNCFSFPRENDEENKTGPKYQIQMMKNLRQINADHNVVGWYQSSYYGSFLSESMIESQFNYQINISKSVMIFYDPLKAKQGLMSLRAFRLNKNFMDLYKDKKFTLESLRKAGLNKSSIFEEFPVKIRSSLLTQALVAELASQNSEEIYEQLELSNEPFLEKNLENMVHFVEDLSAEQNKLHNFYRASARQQIQQQQFLQKFQSENAQRVARGEPPLPEEDLSQNPAFKPLNEPSRLEGLLVTNQIENYCKQINQFAGQSFAKLFLTQGIFDRS